ncbi:DUF3813 domain-containing protein [Guptibacillus hwajinpoensis]|uniref:DUF3813 domain-containing protein n=1 Tax=Guptibacillus hwajinpoensis TaxID=208199 RepID=A0A0J6D3R6_9BACL|nr:DUF3813 domain-containing protein [Alkalihalobacillus macyae]KMM38924.1 hypothetical protein AB986_06640 [Alkalihalobacillus macyae]MDP4550758.1 DUF3813 domain-containing protein [Alkalihalobacillus macyae]
MANRHFQLAREAVEKAQQMAASGQTDLQNQIEIATNNLSAAFHQSTSAEKEQLTSYQQTIQELSHESSNKPF